MLFVLSQVKWYLEQEQGVQMTGQFNQQYQQWSTVVFRSCSRLSTLPAAVNGHVQIMFQAVNIVSIGQQSCSDHVPSCQHYQQRSTVMFNPSLMGPNNEQSTVMFISSLTGPHATNTVNCSIMFSASLTDWSMLQTLSTVRSCSTCSCSCY